MKPTEAQWESFLDSCFGHAPSRWDNPTYRRAALAGYEAGEKKLMENVPADEEEFLARSLSALRATLGA